MEFFDDVLVKSSSAFMDKAKKAGKPFFIWNNTTRMHVFTFLPSKYQAEMNAKDTTVSKRPAWRKWTIASAHS